MECVGLKAYSWVFAHVGVRGGSIEGGRARGDPCRAYRLRQGRLDQHFWGEIGPTFSWSRTNFELTAEKRQAKAKAVEEAKATEALAD